MPWLSWEPVPKVKVDYTVHLAQPQVALLNNACAAHIEGFGGLDGVVRAKSEIFNALTDEDTGIINLDDDHASFWQEKLDNRLRSYLTFSVVNDAPTSGLVIWLKMSWAPGIFDCIISRTQSKFSSNYLVNTMWPMRQQQRRHGLLRVCHCRPLSQDWKLVMP